MDKNHILSEIARTARANGGKPLGWRKFATETGINQTDWFGKHWARWSDAVLEAGCTPNQMREAYDEDELLEVLAKLISETGRYPANSDLRLQARRIPGFPADKTLRRLGTTKEVAARIAERFAGKLGFEGAVKVCGELMATETRVVSEKRQPAAAAPVTIGDVYLVKAGRNCKIGHSNASGRREREIALQLPDKAAIVHVIKTDDPRGIEAYWHRRFAEKRKNGEWFGLAREDIAAFRRRKTM